MKYFKFNLFGPNPPEGYRFVKKGEKFEANDMFFSPFGERNGLITIGNNYPNLINIVVEINQEGYYGYIRKV